MAGNAQISFIGNLGGEPELRFTPSGAAVVNFSVGVAERKKDGDNWVDGETTWYRCNAWRTLAENIAESLTRGARVVVTGTIKSRSYENREGGKGVSWEVEVDGIGPDLRFATAKVQRAERSGGGAPQGGGGWNQGGQQRQQGGGGQYNQGGQYGGGQQRGAAPADDPWGSAPQGGGGYQGGFTDEPPF
jgi:single-strand DNA-binding protein